MKKFKKLVPLVLALTMLLALASCASDNGSGGGSSDNSSAKLKILETEYVVEEYAICIAKDNTELLDKVNAALEELTADGTVDAIITKYIEGVGHDLVFQANLADDAEELVMATNAYFPPYEFYEDGEIVGIDPEIAAAIADKLGMKLTIVDTEFGSIIGGVQTGKYSMGMAGMTVTEERLKSVNFSNTYATGIQVVIVKEGSEITTVDDLYDGDYIIGVQQDTTGHIYSEDDFGTDRVISYNKGADAVQALITGKVDCVIIDNEPAKSFVESNN